MDRCTAIMNAAYRIILILTSLAVVCQCAWLKYDQPEDTYMYYISESDGDSFLGAQKKCEAKGGHLASISNAAAKNLIIANYPDKNRCYWIGLSQYVRDNSNSLVSCCEGEDAEYSDIDTFQWVDGSPRTWTHWAQDDLTWYGYEPQCVVSCYDDRLNDTKWHIRNCENTNRYICKVRNDGCTALQVTNTIGEVFHGMYETVPIQCECCTVLKDNFQRPVYARYANDGTHSSYLYFTKSTDSDQWRVTYELCQDLTAEDAIFVHSDMPYVDMMDMTALDAYEYLPERAGWLKSNVTFTCAAASPVGTTTIRTSTIRSNSSGVLVTERESGMTPIYQIVLGVCAMLIAISVYIIVVVVYIKKGKKKGWKGCCSNKSDANINGSFENVYYEVDSVPGSSRDSTPVPHKTAANHIMNKLHSINKLSLSVLTSNANGVQIVQPRPNSVSTVSYSSDSTKPLNTAEYENIDKEYLSGSDDTSRSVTVELHNPGSPIYDVPCSPASSWTPDSAKSSPTDRFSPDSAKSALSVFSTDLEKTRAISLTKSASFSNAGRALPAIPKHVAEDGLKRSPTAPSDIPNVFGKHPALRATTSSPTINSKNRASSIKIDSLRSHPIFKSKSESLNKEEFEVPDFDSKANESNDTNNEHTYVNAQESINSLKNENHNDRQKSALPSRPVTAAASARPITAGGRPITNGGRPVTTNPRGRSKSPTKGNSTKKDVSPPRMRPVTSISNAQSQSSSKSNNSKQKDSGKKAKTSKVDKEFMAKNPYKVSQIAPLNIKNSKKTTSTQDKIKNGALADVVIS